MKIYGLLFTVMFFLFFAFHSFAEFSADLDFSTYNTTTGLPGTISQTYCTTGECAGDYKCLLDYDGTSNDSVHSGVCYPSSATSCWHNDSFVVGTGGLYCINATAYRTCTDGAWGGITSCISCSGTTCSTNTTGTQDTGGPGGGVDDDTDTTSIRITDFPGNFDIIQGSSVIETVTVKNDGETNLTGITLSASGIDASWHSITPPSIDLNTGVSGDFSLSIAVPDDAEVDSYDVTLTAAAGSTQFAVTFTMRVLPSNQTVVEEILPRFGNFTDEIAYLESRLNELNESGKNITELWDVFNEIKTRLNEADEAIAAGDYFTAEQLLDEVGILIDSLNARIEEAGGFQAGLSDYTLVIAVVILVAVLAFAAFKFRPKGESYFSDKLSTKKKEIVSIEKLAKKLRRFRKKKEETEEEDEKPFRYEFRK